MKMLKSHKWKSGKDVVMKTYDTHENSLILELLLHLDSLCTFFKQLSTLKTLVKEECAMSTS